MESYHHDVVTRNRPLLPPIETIHVALAHQLSGAVRETRIAIGSPHATQISGL